MRGQRWIARTWPVLSRRRRTLLLLHLRRLRLLTRLWLLWLTVRRLLPRIRRLRLHIVYIVLGPDQTKLVTGNLNLSCPAI